MSNEYTYNTFSGRPWKIGDKLVLAYPNNGYDPDIEKAKALIEQHGENIVLTLKRMDVGNFHTHIMFEEDIAPGFWNSVQFRLVNDPDEKESYAFGVNLE